LQEQQQIETFLNFPSVTALDCGAFPWHVKVAMRRMVPFVAVWVLVVSVCHTRAEPEKSQLGIPYAVIPGVDANLLSLDIYRPDVQTAKPLPVVVMVHGGGWAIGDKGNPSVGIDKATFFNANGFVYVSLNYRLSPVVQHPTHAEDVAAAVAWVLEQIGDYGGDPNLVTLMGHSAGAHLAALVATDERYLTKHGKSASVLNGVILLDTAGFDIPRNLEEFSEARAARALYETAFGKDRDRWIEASPITYVKEGKKLPRFLVFFTNRNSASTLSKAFVEAARKAGGTASAVLAEGKSHKTINTDIGGANDGPSRLILDFIAGRKVFPDSI